jgi:hypothetical protein
MLDKKGCALIFNSLRVNLESEYILQPYHVLQSCYSQNVCAMTMEWVLLFATVFLLLPTEPQQEVNNHFYLFPWGGGARGGTVG